MNTKIIQQQNKKKIYKKLYYLFIFYCGRVSKHGYKTLTLKYFMKFIENLYMIEDRIIVANSQEWNVYCNVFHGVGKRNNVNFQQFLKTLFEISINFNKSYDPKDGFTELINQLTKMYNSYTRPTIQNKYIDFSLKITQTTLQYLQKYTSTLYLLYQTYFPEEALQQYQKNDHRNEVNRVFDNVLLFYREFQVYPRILSASDLYFVFWYLVGKEVDNYGGFEDSRVSSLYGKKEEEKEKKEEKTQKEKSMEKSQKQSLEKSFKTQNSQSQKQSKQKSQKKQKSPKQNNADKKQKFNFNKFIFMLIRISILGMIDPTEYINKKLDENKQKMAVKAMLDYLQLVKSNNKNHKYKFHYLKISFNQEVDDKKNVEQKKLQNVRKNKNFYDLFNSIQI